MFASALHLQKTPSRRLGQDQYIRLDYTSSRRLQDVLPRRLQDVLKTSSKRLEKRLQDIFKTSSRRIIKLNCSCEHVFEKHSTRFRDVLFQRRLSTEEYAQVTLLLINLWSVCKICKRDKNFSSFSFTIYYTFIVATFRCVFRTWSNIYNGAFFAKIL